MRVKAEKCGFLLAITTALLLLALPMASAVGPYTITDLGTLGGDESVARGINNQGQVVGWAHNSAGAQRAFLWEGGVMKELASISSPFNEIRVNRINAQGTMCGMAVLPGGGQRALVWTPDNTVTDLGTLGGSDAAAYGINSAGKVVGVARRTDERWHPFVWDNGTMTTFEVFGGYHSAAIDINDEEEIVGSAETSLDGTKNAFMYDQGVTTNLGSLGGYDCWAEEINESGQIAGWGRNSSEDPRALLWDGGTRHELGTFGGDESRAFSINELGNVIGWAELDNGDSHAFVFDYDDCAIYDLNDLVPANFGWVLTEAFDLNDSNQIVGYGYIGDERHAYLLTPVPEPATLALTALGAAFVFTRRRRAR